MSLQHSTGSDRNAHTASQEIRKDLSICWYAAIIWIGVSTVRNQITNSCEEHSKTETAGLTGRRDEDLLCIISVPKPRLLVSFPALPMRSNPQVLAEPSMLRGGMIRVLGVQRQALSLLHQKLCFNFD